MLVVGIQSASYNKEQLEILFFRFLNGIEQQFESRVSPMMGNAIQQRSQYIIHSEVIAIGKEHLVISDDRVVFAPVVIVGPAPSAKDGKVPDIILKVRDIF